jgi:hypothetical protein
MVLEPIKAHSESCTRHSLISESWEAYFPGAGVPGPLNEPGDAGGPSRILLELWGFYPGPPFEDRQHSHLSGKTIFSCSVQKS